LHADWSFNAKWHDFGWFDSRRNLSGRLFHKRLIFTGGRRKRRECQKQVIGFRVLIDRASRCGSLDASMKQPCSQSGTSRKCEQPLQRLAIFGDQTEKPDGKDGSGGQTQCPERPMMN
jgi:hypothetical protein